MYGELDLTCDERSILQCLRSLSDKIRNFRWGKYNRIDPFIETLFGRPEKGNFLGFQNVTIHDSVVMNGDIVIGEYTHIGQQCNLDGSGGLSIGRYCTISAGVRIMTHDTVLKALSSGRQPAERSPVSIQDNCFIGANSVIVRGVKIGHHSVVGAGAVVTKDVPSHTVVAGVPAMPIGETLYNDEGLFFIHCEGKRFSGLTDV